MARKTFGDVMVLLPGITGSVLQRDGKDVWAVNPGAAFRALLSLGRNIKQLQLDGDDPGKPDLGDGVTAPRLVGDIHLIPGFWKIDGYSGIKERLFRQLTLTEGKNWFDFPYDWRRDNRVAAQRLAELAPRWLDAWRRESGNADARLVLLGHSMGGLVSRYYLENLGGWQDTRHLITFGTPYRGSLNAVDSLVNGFRKGFGPLSLDLSALLRSLTSVYQLLPIYESVEAESTGGLARPGEIDLPNVDRARAAAALAFHRDIERSQAQNAQDPRYHDAGYQITPLVGIFQTTNQSARIAGGEAKLLTTYRGEDLGGDGTVPRVSATPIELSDDPRETYAAATHGALQGYAPLLDHIVGRVTRTRLSPFRDTPFDGFGLDAPDLVEPDQPIEVEARTIGPAAQVRITATDVDTGVEHRSRTVRRRADDSFRVELAPLPEGIYRVAVVPEEGSGMRPNSDFVTVLSPATAAAAAAEPPSARS
jgi:pimeloyl-ACP methyl ester carboxylesterase